jgi:hypothetical protein
MQNEYDLTFYPPGYGYEDEEMEPEEQGSTQEEGKEQKGKKEDKSEESEDF